MVLKKSFSFSTGRRRSLIKKRSNKRNMRGGNGFSVNVNGADRIGGQSEILRYSQCPGADPLSKDYGTALYNSTGGKRRSNKRVSKKSRKQRKHKKHSRK